MSYRFQAGENVRDAIQRCASEQLDRAITELSEHIAEDPVEAVHAARKAIKKERALLRLVRGTMPAKQRRRENRALSAAARGLSSARDAEARTDTLAALAERYAGQLPEAAFHEIGDQLKRVRDRQRAQLLGSTLGARAVGDLGAVRLRVEDWTLRRTGWKAIEDGLARTYRDGRKAAVRARSDTSLETWHSWRKRAKDLWYQERLLTAVSGPVVTGHAKDVHRLTDLLGDDHDLGVLRAALTQPPVHAAVDADAVVGLIDHRRHELQADALLVGARAYAEAPPAFLRRMRRSWKAGRRLAGRAAKQRPNEVAKATRAPQRG